MRALLTSIAVAFVVISAFADRSSVNHQELTGTVIGYDPGRSIMIAHDDMRRDGRTLEMAVTRKTRFEGEGQSSAARAMRPGQWVRVRLHLVPGSRYYEAEKVRVLKAAPAQD